MEHSILSPQKFPRFITFVNPLDYENDILVMPDSFIAAYGDEVPSNVKLQFPNGRQFHVLYKKDEKAMYRVGLMYSEFKCHVGSCVLLSYKGGGIFIGNVFSHGRSEIEYEITRRIPRAPVLTQDCIYGKDSKFYSYGIGRVLIDGGTDIPLSYRSRFNIPNKVTFVLCNGELHQGIYSHAEKKLYGLLPIVKKKYLKLWDILMFTYRGDGVFEVSIFEKRVECLFQPDIVQIESDSSDDEAHLTEPENDHHTVDSDGEANGMVRQFTVTMAVSHVDGKSHGVYIPSHISPNGREWRVGEQLLLTTERGSWTVGIIPSSASMRISSGWNAFVMDNNIKVNDPLVFILVEDDEEGIVFYVEIEDSN